MSNIVDAYPREGAVFRTKPLFQWDWGQIVRLHISDLPASYKVEFSNSTRADAMATVQTTDEVTVPAQFLESGNPVYAWVVVVEDEARTTEYSLIIPVSARSKPTDAEPSPEEQTEIEQTLSALNGAVADVQEIADAIPDTINDALEAAKESGEFDGQDGISPTVAITEITGGHRITIIDEVHPNGQVVDVLDGTNGRGIVSVEKTGTSGLTDTYTITYTSGDPTTFTVANGKDGQDAISPEITVASITGGHRITIADANGTHTVDVLDGENGDAGRGIVSVQKTGTAGLVDTYTITYTDGTTSTFTVTNGKNGTDGISPSITVTDITGGHRVTITDVNGTQTVDVMNGVNGKDGDDGVSPTVTVEEISTGHRITITDADGPHSFNVLDGEGGGGGTSEPHNFAFDGANLKDYFADADALWTALAQEDYSHIHLGDYWPVSLSGDYWDYGGNTVPIGTTYYSDAGCTTEAGTTEAAYTTSAINDTAVPGGAKAYVEIKISNITYYVKLTDTLPYVVRTLSDALMIFEAMPNHYWRYGDSGSLNFHNGRPHILFSARDGLPHTLKMRKGNEIWEDTNIAEFTGDGTTAEFTVNGTVGTFGYVFVGGVRKTYNTDYTYSGNKITFKANKQPANGALVQVEWMAAKTPWTGGAIYKTFNDPDHGIIHLIQQADEKLYNHIYKGSNNKGMRYCGETRSKTGQQSSAWEDRGVLFLPTEDEVWGRLIRATGSEASCNMQQWPIYQLGGRRHFMKGAGAAASRYTVWCASSTSVTNFACVNSYGNPGNNNASIAFVAAPGFIFCEAPA